MSALPAAAEAVAAGGLSQLPGAVFHGLSDIATGLGWLCLASMLCVAVLIGRAVAEDMRHARKRKQNLKGAAEVGDDVIEMLEQWDDAAFDRGLKRLMGDIDRG